MSDPFSGYDAWKTTPPEWRMPYHVERVADRTEWRMRKQIDWFDGDESRYEFMCEEWGELARIDAHERPPEDEDFEDGDE